MQEFAGRVPAVARRRWSIATERAAPSRIGTRAPVAVLSMALALATSAEARAASGSEPDAAAAQRRQELHNAGQQRFDAGDYEGALTLWIDAHEQLPPDPELEAYRAVLLHAIAEAALRASEHSGEREPLVRAKAVYEQDLDPQRGPERGGVSDQEQLAALVERERELDAALADGEARDGRAPSSTGPGPGAVARVEPAVKARSIYMYFSPGILAVDLEDGSLGYQYSFGGGPLWTRPNGFTFAVGGGFEHWLRLNEMSKAHVIGLGGELRVGASRGKWFAYGMTGVFLDIYNNKTTNAVGLQSQETRVGVGFPISAGFWWYFTRGFFVGSELGPDLDIRPSTDIAGMKTRELAIPFQWKVLLGGRF